MENDIDVSKTKKLVNIPPNASIRVDWQDYPENRTLETINRVKTYFADKYEISKTSVKINFIPILPNPPVNKIFIFYLININGLACKKVI